MATPLKMMGAYTLTNDTSGTSETAYSVDKISTDIINDNDLVFAEHNNGLYFYNAVTYGTDVSENVPYYIKPNDETGFQRWSLMNLYANYMVADSLSANNGTVITAYNNFAAPTLSATTVMYASGGTVLTTNNEGHNNGIDVDTVDTYHGSDLLARANHTGTQSISTLSDHSKANHDSLLIDAATLDTLDSTQFLRSDVSDTFGGTTLTLNTQLAGSAVKDEDNMTSDSAVAVATQQSIKAYVDNSVAGASIFTTSAVDQTGSRALSTTYTNSSTRPRLVVVQTYANVTAPYSVAGAYIGAVTASSLIQQTRSWVQDSAGDYNRQAGMLVFVVPVGWKYKVATISQSPTILYWSEMD